MLGDLTLVDEPKAKKLKRDYDIDHLQLFEEANKVLKGLDPGYISPLFNHVENFISYVEQTKSKPKPQNKPTSTPVEKANVVYILDSCMRCVTQIQLNTVTFSNIDLDLAKDLLSFLHNGNSGSFISWVSIFLLKLLSQWVFFQTFRLTQSLISMDFVITYFVLK